MRRNFIFFLVLSALVTSNGTQNSPKELPHLARWWDERSEKPCVASLITDQHLLTQASCILDSNEPLKVQLGGLDEYTQITVDIKELITHPGYKHPRRYNDIAILVLHEPIQLTRQIYPACVEKFDPITKTDALATSWKPISEYDFRKYLSEETVELRKIKDCKEIETFPFYEDYLPNGVNETTMLCAEEKNLSNDLCDGESGGALQIQKATKNCEYTIIGIPILRNECLSKVGLYTKVSSYYNWIKAEVTKVLKSNQQQGEN